MTFRKAVSEPVGEPLPDWAKVLLRKLDEKKPAPPGGQGTRA